MPTKTLERELGLILTATGPAMMERAYWFRRMAELVEKDAPETAKFLTMQADRMEECVVNLARENERYK